MRKELIIWEVDFKKINQFLIVYLVLLPIIIFLGLLICGLVNGLIRLHKLDFKVALNYIYLNKNLLDFLHITYKIKEIKPKM